MLKATIAISLLFAASPALADTINGQITAVQGANVTLQTCSGVVQMDASTAIADEKTVTLQAGSDVGAKGTMQGGVFQATAIWNKRIPCN